MSLVFNFLHVCCHNIFTVSFNIIKPLHSLGSKTFSIYNKNKGKGLALN